MNNHFAGDALFEELDYRLHDGVAVSLVWWRAENRVSVLVADSRSGAAFELPVGDESPLDVFHHPFAYAAFLGIEHVAPQHLACATTA